MENTFAASPAQMVELDVEAALAFPGQQPWVRVEHVSGTALYRGTVSVWFARGGYRYDHISSQCLGTPAQAVAELRAILRAGRF